MYFTNLSFSSPHSHPFPKHLHNPVPSFFSPYPPLLWFSDGSWGKRLLGSQNQWHTVCIVCEVLWYPEISVFFHNGSLDLKDFLSCVHASTIAPVRALVAILTEKRQRRTSEHFTNGFPANENRVMQELGTKQVRQF